MQEVLNVQKRFVDSCQRVQLDDPTHVADVLDKLIDSLINKYAILLNLKELFCYNNVYYILKIIVNNLISERRLHSTSCKIFKFL